uniref:Transthyretin-like family protein n=1 Tax=Panagrolaimus sp. ES5 TaxID=591445 RepID=A0AC34G7M1_9BILA
MAEGTTDSSGRFSIQGSEKEFTTIDPQLRIFHKCSNAEGRCYKKASLEIADEYISEGKVPTKFFDVGNLELKSLSSQDTKDCN